jgi:hypothetical protein
VLNMIEHFGTGAFATVMDSYDYTAALNQILPGAPWGCGRDACCDTSCHLLWHLLRHMLRILLC